MVVAPDHTAHVYDTTLAVHGEGEDILLESGNAIAFGKTDSLPDGQLYQMGAIVSADELITVRAAGMVNIASGSRLVTSEEGSKIDIQAASLDVVGAIYAGAAIGSTGSDSVIDIEVGVMSMGGTGVDQDGNLMIQGGILQATGLVDISSGRFAMNGMSTITAEQTEGAKIQIQALDDVQIMGIIEARGTGSELVLTSPGLIVIDGDLKAEDHVRVSGGTHASGAGIVVQPLVFDSNDNRLSGGSISTGANGKIELVADADIVVHGAVGKQNELASGEVSLVSQNGEVSVTGKVEAQNTLLMQGKNVNILTESLVKTYGANATMNLVAEDRIYLVGYIENVEPGVISSSGSLTMQADMIVLDGAIESAGNILANASTDILVSGLVFSNAEVDFEAENNIIVRNTASVKALGSVTLDAAGDVKVLATAEMAEGLKASLVPIITTNSSVVDVITGYRRVAVGTIEVPKIYWVQTTVTEQVGMDSVKIGNSFRTMDVTLTQDGYYNGTTTREFFVENIDYWNEHINWTAYGVAAPVHGDTAFSDLTDDQRAVVLSVLGYKPLYNFSFGNAKEHKNIDGVASTQTWTPEWRNNPNVIVNIPVAGWSDKYIRMQDGAQYDVLRVVSQGAPNIGYESVGQWREYARIRTVQATSYIQDGQLQINGAWVDDFEDDENVYVNAINRYNYDHPNSTLPGMEQRAMWAYETAFNPLRQFNIYDGRNGMSYSYDPEWIRNQSYWRAGWMNGIYTWAPNLYFSTPSSLSNAYNWRNRYEAEAWIPNHHWVDTSYWANNPVTFWDASTTDRWKNNANFQIGAGDYGNIAYIWPIGWGSQTGTWWNDRISCITVPQNMHVQIWDGENFSRGIADRDLILNQGEYNLSDSVAFEIPYWLTITFNDIMTSFKIWGDWISQGHWAGDYYYEWEHDYDYDWHSTWYDIYDKRLTLNYQWVSNSQEIWGLRPRYETYEMESKIVETKTLTDWQNQAIVEQRQVNYTTRSYNEEGQAPFSEFKNDAIAAGSNLTILSGGETYLRGILRASGDMTVTAGTGVMAEGLSLGEAILPAQSKLIASGNIALSAGTALNLTESVLVQAEANVTIEAGTQAILKAEISSGDEVMAQANDNIELKGKVLADNRITVYAGTDGTGSILGDIYGDLYTMSCPSEIVLHAGSLEGDIILENTSVATDPSLISLVALSGRIYQSGAAMVADRLDAIARDGFTANTSVLMANVQVTGSGNIILTNASETQASLETGQGNITLSNIGNLILTKATTGEGNITVQSVGDMDAVQVMTVEGSISLEAAGTMTANYVVTQGTQGNNNIALSTRKAGDSNADLVLGTVSVSNADRDDITLDIAGKILGNGNITADHLSVRAEEVNLYADINSLELATLAAGDVVITDDETSVSTGKTIVVEDRDNLILEKITVLDGSLSISVANTVTMNEVSLLTNSEANNITVHAGGDILLDRVSSGVYAEEIISEEQTSLGDITLIAGGKLVQTDADSDIDIIADVLTLEAGNSDIVFEIAANRINRAITASGSISLKDSDGYAEARPGLIVDSVETVSGNITIESEGGMVMTEAISGGDDTVVRLKTQEGNLEVYNIQASSGIALDAGKNLKIQLPVAAPDLLELRAGDHFDFAGNDPLGQSLNLTSKRILLETGKTMTFSGILTATEEISLISNADLFISGTIQSGTSDPVAKVNFIARGEEVILKSVSDARTGMVKYVAQDGTALLKNVEQNKYYQYMENGRYILNGYYVNASGQTETRVYYSNDPEGTTLYKDANGAVVVSQAERNAITYLEYRLTEASGENSNPYMAAEQSEGLVHITGLSDAPISDLDIIAKRIEWANDGNLNIANAHLYAEKTITLQATGELNLESTVAQSLESITLEADKIQAWNAGQAALITDNLIMKAVSGIQVYTDVNHLTANITGEGNLRVNESNNIVLDQVFVQDGSISVKAQNDITAMDVKIYKDQIGNNVLLSGANIYVDEIVAGIETGNNKQAGVIRIVTPGVIREVGWDTEPELVANKVDLRGPNVASHNLGIKANQYVTSTSLIDNVIIYSPDEDVVLDMGEYLGVIDVTAKNIILRDVADMDSANITLNASGYILFETSVKIGDGTMRLTGSDIYSKNDLYTLQGRDLFITATNEADLNTDFATLTTGASGTLDITEKDALTIHSLAANGTVAITAGGSIAATSINTGDDLTLVSGGTITGTIVATDIANLVAASTIQANVTANNLIASGTGLNLTTAVNIANLQSSGSITMAEQDSIAITANSGYDMNLTAGGDVQGTLHAIHQMVVNSNGSISGEMNTTNSYVWMYAKGDINATVSSMYDSVYLRAEGAITGTMSAVYNWDVNLIAGGNIAATVHAANNSYIEAGGSLQANVTANDLTANAGAAANLDTNIQTATITAANIQMTEANDILLHSIKSTEGSLSINAGGNIVATTVISADDATMIATGSISATIQAADDVTLAAGTDITAMVNAGADANIQAGSDIQATVNAVNHVNMTAGAAISADAIAGDDVIMVAGTAIQTNITTASDISLTAGTSITADITGDGLVLNSGDAVVLNTNIAEATVTAGKAIQINEANDILLNNVETLTESVAVNAGGNIHATSIVSAEDTSLTAIAGINANINAGDDVEMTAGTFITASVNALDDVNMIAGTSITATIAGDEVNLTAGSDVLADVTGDELVVNAGETITLQTQVNTIQAVNQTGDVAISEVDNVSILSLSTANEGNMLVEAGGTLYLNTEATTDPISTYGNITMDAGIAIEMMQDTRVLSHGGNITFDANVKGDSLLTLAAQEGSIAFNSTLGAGTAVSGLKVESAGSLSFQDTVETDDQGIDITAGYVNFLKAITTTNGGAMEVTNSGLLTIANAADMNLDGSFEQNGTGSVITGGSIKTTNDGIRFAKDITLIEDVVFDTDSEAGDIRFGDSIDSIAGTSYNLTLDAGKGSVSFNNNIGERDSIGSLSVLRAEGGVTFGEAIPVNLIQLDGAMNIGTGSNTILGTGIVLNSGNGTLAIKINNASARFNGRLTLATDVTIDTTSGDILFTNDTPIDSEAGKYNRLILDAGSGKVSFNENIGETQALKDLVVKRAEGGVVFGEGDPEVAGTGTVGPVEIINLYGNMLIGSEDSVEGGIVLNGGTDYGVGNRMMSITSQTGNIFLNGPVVLASDVDMMAILGSIHFTGTIDAAGDQTENLELTSGGTITLDKSIGETHKLGRMVITNLGAVNIANNADIYLDGTFTQRGLGAVTTGGSITTSDDEISFTSALILTNDIVFNAGHAPIYLGSDVTGDYHLTLITDTVGFTRKHTDYSYDLVANGDPDAEKLTIQGLWTGATRLVFDSTLETVKFQNGEWNVVYLDEADRLCGRKYVYDTWMNDIMVGSNDADNFHLCVGGNDIVVAGAGNDKIVANDWNGHSHEKHYHRHYGKAWWYLHDDSRDSYGDHLGDVLIEAGSGNDYIDLYDHRRYENDDIVRAGAGNDEIKIHADGYDFVDGGSGYDKLLERGSRNDTLIAIGIEEYNGSRASAMVVSDQNASYEITKNMTIALHNGNDILDLRGVTYYDTHSRKDYVVSINGNGGNDLIYVGGGLYDVDAGSGNDIVYASHLSNINGGSGYDMAVLSGSAADWTVNTQKKGNWTATHKATGKSIAIKDFETIEYAVNRPAEYILPETGIVAPGNTGSNIPQFTDAMSLREYMESLVPQYIMAEGESILDLREIESTGYGTVMVYGNAINNKIFLGDANYEVYGGAGDDTFYSSMTAILHGDEGFDIAVLKGTQADWTITEDWWLGSRATHTTGTEVHLQDVEMIQYTEQWIFAGNHTDYNFEIVSQSNAANAGKLMITSKLENDAISAVILESDIKTISFADGNWNVLYADEDNRIYDTCGNDILVGTNADDNLYALNGGTDIILGGAGDDTLKVKADGNDIIEGGSGLDYLDVSGSSSYMVVANGIERYNGSAASEYITGDKAFFELDQNLSITLQGGSDTIDFRGTTFTDNSGWRNNTHKVNISGSGGTDTIYLGGGVYNVSGGDGSDLIYASQEADGSILNGGYGFDTLLLEGFEDEWSIVNIWCGMKKAIHSSGSEIFFENIEQIQFTMS